MVHHRRNTQVKREPVSSAVSMTKSDKQHKVLLNSWGIDVYMPGEFTVSLYDLVGKQMRNTLHAHEAISILLKRYICSEVVKDEVQYADKIIVM